MNKRLFFLAVTFFCGQLLFAQTSSDSTGIMVHTNRRLDEMMKKQFTGITAKQAAMAKNINYKIRRPGYRILVLSTNDRDLTYRTKGQLLGRYPDQQIYTVYQAPFFKLKLGDFTSRHEAENYRSELAKTFTKGVFILHETVWAKPEDESKM